MKPEDPKSWSTRSDRKPVELRGFALADGVDADIIISDMSYDGCQLRSSHSFALGDRLDLRIIGRGGVRAEVRWVAGECAGVRFIGDD